MSVEREITAVDDYTPEIVEHHLRHWQELAAAAEGGTGTLNGGGAGRGGRMALVCMVADLERAADKLPINWTTTHAVYVLQGRLKAWHKRVEDAGGLGAIAMQHRAVEHAAEHMARVLGWKG